MEWKTLNNLCLANQAAVSYATNWSKDGRLSIITENCVYILKFSPKMTSTENIISFTKSEIRISNYYVADNTGINYEDILLSLAQRSLYHNILNYNMTPKMSNTNIAKTIPISAAWSPIPGNSVYKTNALFAVLSNTGNLEIFCQYRIKWFQITNITKCWLENLQKNWKDTNLRSDGKIEIHMKRVNQCLATCFEWSQSFCDKNEIYFYIVIGHLDGLISIWKLKYIKNFNEKPVPNLVHSFETFLNNLTSLHIQFIDNNSAQIIVGNLDGYVKNFEIRFDGEKSEKKIDIWTHNDVRVSKIISTKIDKNYCVLILKGSFIIFAVISNENTLLSVDHKNLGNINITGIETLNSNSFVTTTTTGIINKLEIVKDLNKFELKIFPINTDITWEYHSCHGVSKSPNENILAFLTYPCKIIDHLVLRNPIQIIFCTAQDFHPIKQLQNHPTTRLLDSWECIEILRCFSAKNNELPCTLLEKVDKYDNLSLFQTRLFMWISLISETFIQKRSRCRTMKNSLPETSVLKEILYFKYRLERIKSLLEKIESNNYVSDFYYFSLYILFDAIKSFENSNEYSLFFGKETNDELKKITGRYKNIAMKKIPKCLWCEENLSHKHCEMNHPDQRCCISGVQITGIAKWECERCGIPAHELVEDEVLFCPLCDIPMIQNTF